MIPGIGSVGAAKLLIPLVIVFLFSAVKRFPGSDERSGSG
jgi:hypothetical protein